MGRIIEDVLKRLVAGIFSSGSSSAQGAPPGYSDGAPFCTWTFLNEWQLGTLLAECGGCRMWTPSLLCHGHGDLGVAGAGALGARLHDKGEREAVTGLRVGGHDESGVHRPFLPQ